MNLIKLTFIAGLTLCFAPLSAHVELDYPVGGESFESGQVVQISWHIVIQHDQIDWDVYFSSNGGDTWEPLQLGIPVSVLQYDWTVPEINTTSARILVVQDNVGGDYEDMSLPFTISSGSQPPVIITGAQDITLDCGSSQGQDIQDWLDNAGSADATVYCGDGTWTNDFTGLTDDCGDSGQATVQFTLTDDCGNSVVTSATVTVIDNTPPVIGQQASVLMLQCDGSGNMAEITQWLSSHGGATATDDCGGITWSDNFSAMTDGCGASGSAEVTFVATDPCGQSSMTTAMIQIMDQTPPVIATPARDTVLHCDSEDVAPAISAWLGDHAGARATDACSDLSWEHDFVMPSDLCSVTRDINVTFVVTDGCGNFNSSTAMLTIEMTTGLHDIDFNVDIKLYPNPCHDLLVVRLPSGLEDPRLTLFDAGGQALAATIPQDDLTLIPTDHLVSGVYFLQIADKGHRVVRKVIVR